MSSRDRASLFLASGSRIAISDGGGLHRQFWRFSRSPSSPLSAVPPGGIARSNDRIQRLDTIASLSDPAGMPYPGGKNGAGVYQKIINLMPPHRVYIEPFFGSGAIFRLKRPAQVNIGLDLDPAVIDDATGVIAGCDGPGRDRRIERGAPATIVTVGDAISWLAHHRFIGDELVYCDPPYVRSTRKSSRETYPGFEMTDLEHRRLLRVLRKIPAMVMISGYWSALYADALVGWNSFAFKAMTRGGKIAIEWVWFNFPEPAALHDYAYLGANFRERERINRRKRRWAARLRRMPQLERFALLSVIETEWFSGHAESSDASSSAG